MTTSSTSSPDTNENRSTPTASSNQASTAANAAASMKKLADTVKNAKGGAHGNLPRQADKKNGSNKNDHASNQQSGKQATGEKKKPPFEPAKAAKNFAHNSMKGKNHAMESAQKTLNKVAPKEDTKAQRLADKSAKVLNKLGPKGKIAGAVVQNSLPIGKLLLKVVLAFAVPFGFTLLAIFGGGTSMAAMPTPAVSSTPGEITKVNEQDLKAIETAFGIPPKAMESYIKAAASTEMRLDPNAQGCRLRWQMIGAVGNFESGHGTNAQNPKPYFQDNGDTVGVIKTQGSTAQGVFQFVNGTWNGISSRYDVDLNHDSVENRDNVYDEALAAGILLCRNSPKDFSVAGQGGTEADMDNAYWGYCGTKSACPYDMTTRTKWALEHDQYTVCSSANCGSKPACAEVVEEGKPLPACVIRVTQTSVGTGALNVDLITVGNYSCPVAGSPKNGNAAQWSNSYGAPRSGGRQHKGVDMMGQRGTPIVAPIDGLVWWSNNSLGGHSFHLQGDDGIWYYGAHLDTYADIDGNGVGGDEFKPGSSKGYPTRVTRGQLLGTLGNSGASWADPHLHFEVLPKGPEQGEPYQGNSVDPTPFVDRICWNGNRAPLGAASS